MRNWFTLILLLLVSNIASAQTDARVDAVYTLAKIPAPLGVYRHIVQARLSNAGSTNITDLAVTLTVSGANSFTDTQLVSIDAGGSVLIGFNAFSPWNPGANTVTVSIPSDDNNTNNSAAYTQLVNDHVFSYADDAPPVSSVGFGTGDGMLLTRYEVSGSAVVKQVNAYISNASENIGKTVYAAVTEFGSIAGQSAPHIITAAELNTWVSFTITDPPTVSSEFFAGMVQTSDGVSEYYPLAYQDEGATPRPNAYFASLTDGSGMTSLDFIGRLMIQAVVDIGTVTPFNSSPYSVNSYPIAGWDFSGVNSPATFGATTFDTLLSSSNLLTRGAGAAATAGVHTFRTNGFHNDGIATSNTDYFQVTLSPKPGDTLSLSSISGYLHGNSDSIPVSGINSQFAYSLDGVNFTLIGSPLLTTNFVELFNVSTSSILALQTITSGTTVTIRYYASGAGASGDWGFISIKPGTNGLSINGKLATSNKLLTAPVVPTGADFNLADCNATAIGSISFTSTGTFSPNNKYKVILGDIYEPHANIFIFQDTVTIGSITSNANSGVINFTLPAGARQNDAYALRIVSTAPYVSGSLSQLFRINNNQNCKSQRQDNFRSKASGNWTDLNTWESFNGQVWTAATLIPDDLAGQIEISSGTSVSVTSNINITSIIVKGTLKLLNDQVNKGIISLNSPPFLQPSSMRIDTSGILQIVSVGEAYNDVMMYINGGRIRVFGKILIGDAGAPVAADFEKFATQSSCVWFSGSTFEWNAATTFATNGMTYFETNSGVPTFRLTNIGAATLGGENNTTINGILEVNTPVTWTGSGTKTFRDGIKGSSILNQTTGAGKFIVSSSYAEISSSLYTSACLQGIIGGNVSINLNGDGMTLEQGITFPTTSAVNISGATLSLQTTTVQENASVALTNSSVFTLDNADLLNLGSLNGPGLVQFTGSTPSILTSPGTLTAPLVLTNKKLSLGSNCSTADVSLTNISNLTLGTYDLLMGTNNLVADESNFIVSSDIGRLSRYVATTPVLYPVGINSNSYTAVTITNAGTAANIKAGVIQGVQSSMPLTSGNVDRTWIIGDTAQSGIDLTLNMQWNAGDEQPGFDRTHCYISHYVSCPLDGCVPFFDDADATNCSGTTFYNIQRSGIINFWSPAFIVTSKQSVYTFTGNGDWNNASNWTPAVVAPVVIPPGTEVYIDAIPTGECLYDGNITIKQGGKLKVQPGKKLRITGNLSAE